MDTKYIKENSVIERYLTNQLTKEELEKFSLLLMRDEALQKKVKANRLLFKTLWKAGNGHVDSQPLKKNSSHKNLLWIIFLLAILSAVFWLIPTDSMIEKEVSEGSENVESSTSIMVDSVAEKEAKIIETDVKKENQSIDNQKVIEEENTKQDIRKTIDKKKTEPRPIAGNFEVNPLLENYFTNKRGKGMSISSPQQIAQFELKDGEFPFEITGTFEPKSNQIDEPVLFYLFSNKKEDYQQFRPLISEELKFEFEETEKVFQFQWTQDLDLKPGLYYYQIEGEDSGLFYVGKFEVR